MQQVQEVRGLEQRNAVGSGASTEGGREPARRQKKEWHAFEEREDLTHGAVEGMIAKGLVPVTSVRKVRQLEALYHHSLTRVLSLEAASKTLPKTVKLRSLQVYLHPKHDDAGMRDVLHPVRARTHHVLPIRTQFRPSRTSGAQ